jgi:hypothetical protein
VAAAGRVAWTRRAARARHRARRGRQDLTGRQAARRLTVWALAMGPRSCDAAVRRDCAAADSRSHPGLDGRGWSRRGRVLERTARRALGVWGRLAARTERLPIAGGEWVWRGRDLTKILEWNRAKYQLMSSNDPWPETAPGWLRMTRGVVRFETLTRRSGAEDRCGVDPGAGPRLRLKTVEAAARAVRRLASYPGKVVQAQLGFA